MKSKLIIGLSVLTLMGGAMVAPSIINAYQGEPGMQGPNCTEERHQAMTQAFENNDYQAWKELMQGRGRASELINEDNFDRFAEAHQLALEGKTEEAKQIRQELGLGLGNRYGNRDGRGNKSGWNK